MRQFIVMCCVEPSGGGDLGKKRLKRFCRDRVGASTSNSKMTRSLFVYFFDGIGCLAGSVFKEGVFSTCQNLLRKT